MEEGSPSLTKKQLSDNKAGIHSGGFVTRKGINEPFQPDHELYKTLGNMRGGEEKALADQEKLPNCNLLGTRFCKTRSEKEPWRPNNPAKRGHNRTLNKMPYYHQGMHYKEKRINQNHEEKIWM